MVRISDRGQRHLDVVSTIFTRIQEFKNSKNLTVENYDALVAAASAAKTTAQTAVDAAKQAKADFKCDGTDPKGSASAFEDTMKAEHAAVKAYRDAVHDLLVAVKKAAGTTTSTVKSSDDSTKTTTTSTKSTTSSDTSTTGGSN
jgi:hypothetical protein